VQIVKDVVGISLVTAVVLAVVLIFKIKGTIPRGVSCLFILFGIIVLFIATWTFIPVNKIFMWHGLNTDAPVSAGLGIGLFVFGATRFIFPKIRS
jgi:hypothetical protein